MQGWLSEWRDGRLAPVECVPNVPVNGSNRLRATQGESQENAASGGVGDGGRGGGAKTIGAARRRHRWMAAFQTLKRPTRSCSVLESVESSPDFSLILPMEAEACCTALLTSVISLVIEPMTAEPWLTF